MWRPAKAQHVGKIWILPLGYFPTNASQPDEVGPLVAYDGLLRHSLGDALLLEEGGNSSMAERTSFGVIQPELSSAWGVAETMMVVV